MTGERVHDHACRTDGSSRAGRAADRRRRRCSSTSGRPAPESRTSRWSPRRSAAAAGSSRTRGRATRGSTRQAGRSVADCVEDVARSPTALGLERLHVVGWSGGGPHALACAALLPELVASAATLAGVAPWDAEGLDWLDGMAEENHEEFGAALAGDDALTRFLEPFAARARDRRTADTVAEMLGGLVTDVDRRALTGEFADSRRRSFRTGGRERDLGLARRRPRVHARLGLRARRDRRCR